MHVEQAPVPLVLLGLMSNRDRSFRFFAAMSFTPYPPCPLPCAYPGRNKLTNRGENDIWRALGAAAESSPSRNSVSGAAGGAAAVTAVPGVASLPAASSPGLAIFADANACAGGGRADLGASSGGDGGVNKPAASASSPLRVAGTARGASEDQQLNPVLETLFKALPPGLAELSTREWVSKAATAGRVDFLEVTACEGTGVVIVARGRLHVCVACLSRGFRPITTQAFREHWSIVPRCGGEAIFSRPTTS